LAEHVHQDIGVRPVQESRSRVREKALMQRPRGALTATARPRVGGLRPRRRSPRSSV
jgi:hypothetical protein